MNPCCGVSNQRGTQIIAVLEITVGIVFLVLLKYVGVAKMLEIFGGVTQDKIPAAESVTVLSVVCTILGLLCLLLAALLLVGANKRNRTLCMVWFVATIIGLFISTVATILSLSTGGGFAEFSEDVLLLSIDCFCLWVVWEFMKELKHSSALSNSCSYRV